ncbi:oxidoreductase [Deinococcus sp. 6GRE01]|uniref:oxidoreductase n=1 Tax=Deinococcus sp. 6GRE01 TaxID=2745873 RepID=UPI001E2D7924|nr:oxidoreductase [Deinococcus sp. 6GRE01]MCD0158970.1 SDR family NAD(P)-dependent oxidoreductase [Deinococcus sp. 6GRE01]
MTPIKSPLAPRADAADLLKDTDLRGRTAVVTGGASGLGVETVRALLGAGARVIMPVRDTVRGEQVARDLAQETGNSDVHVLHLDLGSLASVRRAAAAILAAAPRIHILINNAGVMATPQGLTADGFETQFGTNHLGHFQLTRLLMPALLAAAPARVVALSSSAHRLSDIRWDDPNFQTTPYDPWQAYGQSKTANALFAVELNRRYGLQGVTANAVHPGGIMTGLQKHMPEGEAQRRGWIDENGVPNPAFKTPAQGASTSVWAATAPELDGVGGLFLEDLQQSTPLDGANPSPLFGYKPHALDGDSARRLWTLSEELIDQTGQ